MQIRCLMNCSDCSQRWGWTIGESSISVMMVLCGCGEGMKEIGERRAGGANAGGLDISVVGVVQGGRLLVNPRSVPSMQSLSVTGPPRARMKAQVAQQMFSV